MSFQPPSAHEDKEPDVGIPSGVIAQAQAVAASNAVRDGSSIGQEEVSVIGTGQSNAAIRSISDLDSRESIRTEHRRRSGTATSRPEALSNASLHETPIEDVPPPAYSEIYGQMEMNQDGIITRADVASDGRVDININQKSRRLSNLLVPALQSQLNLQDVEQSIAPPPGYIPPSLGGLPGQRPPPPMNVVIHVVGSRGDVQPFVSLGQVLQNTYGHHVRLATHPIFRKFVEENGLEFFSIGGDPAELMAFMVKNPGLIPGKDALRKGDIGKRRKGMYEIIKGCWRSCFEAGDGTGLEVSDNQFQDQNPPSNDSGTSSDTGLADKPFIADAIIANPPSFAHIHCAEKLGIPLHLMFTMPWSATQVFPHPLANIQSSNADVNMTNFISYVLVEMMTWQGLGDIINRFREKSLGLEPVGVLWAPTMASRLRIPYTYCWSPALIPKPKDWGRHISVAGFYFLSLANNYTAPAELQAFLDAGPPPVYVGFGSIVVDDPNAMTKLIFEAVRLTGQRALVSKGWGGLGAGELGIPDDVFMLGNVPHDWLFKHVSCVVHHGGAGTTAAGIAAGKPTVVVPFFGDQPFWGAMIAKAGAGPEPISNKELTAENLAAAIREALKPTTLERAQDLGRKISNEKGSDVGGQKFHETLDVDKLRCSLAPSRIAVWRLHKTQILLSAFAATVLGNEGLLDFKDLRLHRSKEYDNDDGPWDPISGGASALLGTIGSMMMGVADLPIEAVKALSKSSKNSGKGRDDMPSTSTTESAPAHGRTTPISSAQETATSRASSMHASSSPQLATWQDSGDPAIIRADHSQSDRSSSPSVLNWESVENVSPEVVSVSRSADDSDQQLSATSLAEPPSRDSSSKPSRDQLPRRSPQITYETVLVGGKGLSRFVGAGLKSPLDFSLAIARGFHNAPKLYGDKNVRRPDKITDFQSGLKAAGKEFGYGFYDGISGLVTQPLAGAKTEGVAGALKGFGKGIGGLILKPGAAIWGLPGYTFQGIYKELQKSSGSNVQNYIIAARTAQGYEDWQDSTREECVDVVKRWQVAQVELAKQRRQWSRRHLASAQASSKAKDKSSRPKRKAREEQRTGSTSDIPGVEESVRAPSLLVPTSPVEDEFEDAIHHSVERTSTGNPHEDELIERAIRASVAELHGSYVEGGDDDVVARAIRASIAEVNRLRSERPSDSKRDTVQTGDYDDQDLAAAIRASMDEHDSRVHEDGEEKRDDSGIDTDEDENIKLALERSRHLEASLPCQDDEELERALKESQEQEAAKQMQRREEEIVMEYVKKQSLAEEEYRKKV